MLKKLILQLPPYVSACDLYSQVFLSPAFWRVHYLLLVGRPTGPYIVELGAVCEVLARAELFEGICHVS